MIINNAKLDSNYPVIPKIFGITKHPQTEEYVIVMEYFPEGDLRTHFQKRHGTIDWDQKRKLAIEDCRMSLDRS
jgi:hypothetical protein